MYLYLGSRRRAVPPSRALTSFCIIKTEKLVKRVQDGIASQKYKKVDYDQLKALAAKKKLAGEEKLIKVRFIEKTQIFLLFFF